MKYFAVLLSIIFLVSCKKEAQQEKTASVHTDTTAVAAAVPDKAETSKLEKLVAEFSKLRKNTVAKLPSLKPEEANRLYDEYEKKNKEIIGKLNNVEGNLLADYYTHFYDRYGDPIKLHDTIQHKKDVLEKAGLEFWGIGEGMAEIRPVHDFYLKIFKDHVTNDYKRFLVLQSSDDSSLWSADAGIAITWEELSLRVIHWEGFIVQYPESKLYDHASFNYHMYRYSYLFGQDNTPTHEHEDNKLYPEMVAEFNRFIRKHPDSQTTKLVKQMLANNGTIGFEGIRERENEELQKAYDAFYKE